MVTTPAPATSPPKKSNATLLNTVVSCNAHLPQMEQEWAQTRSGPFPERIQNTITSLCVALVMREAEALHGMDIPVLDAYKAAEVQGDGK